jgi:glyoxylase-like metal-dependent hydrolase (beta-lactamase superfamily II)
MTGALSMAIVRAQRDPAAVHIENVKNNLYVITGGRGTGVQANTISGNTTVFVTDNGVVLVDTKLPGFGQAILDQVRSVTTKPVTMVINTHTHNDHTGGNPELPRTIEYIAHENTRTNMARMDLFKGNNAALLPKRTFKDKMSLLAGKDRIDLYYFGAGHTNGDAIIVFPALRVAALGDLFARKWAPLVDAGNGGSATAFPDTLANAVAGIKDVDTVITGHSTTPIGRSGTFTPFNPAAKWSDLQEYAGFTREFVSAARVALAAGKTVDEAVSGLKLPDKYRSYDMTNAKADVQRVYEESRRAQSNPNALPNPYRLVEGWPTLPVSMNEGKWGELIRVDLDPKGNIWVFHRCFNTVPAGAATCIGRDREPPILQFDPSGKLLASFGQGIFAFPHGFTVDHDENVWATDANGNETVLGMSTEGRGQQVFKFSPTGEVLMTVGTRGVAGNGPDSFDQPTGVAVAANGDVFVTDGHGKNDRVVKFSKDGRFVKAWGKHGAGPGEFDQPHDIALDSKGRLFIADRSNSRVQIFDHWRQARYLHWERDHGHGDSVHSRS